MAFANRQAREGKPVRTTGQNQLHRGIINEQPREAKPIRMARQDPGHWTLVLPGHPAHCISPKQNEEPPLHPPETTLRLRRPLQKARQMCKKGAQGGQQRTEERRPLESQQETHQDGHKMESQVHRKGRGWVLSDNDPVGTTFKEASRK